MSEYFFKNSITYNVDIINNILYSRIFNRDSRINYVELFSNQYCMYKICKINL